MVDIFGFPDDVFGEVFGGSAPGDLTDAQYYASLGVGLVLDADLGLFTTSAGSTPAAADDDPVGRWEDQSGSGRHFIQATDASRPLLKTALFNERNAIRFNGTSSVMTSSFDASGGIATPTVFVVCTHTGSALRGWVIAEATWRGSMLFATTTSFAVGDGSDSDANSKRAAVANPGAGLHIYINDNKNPVIIDTTEYTSFTNAADGTNTTSAQIGARNNTAADFYGGDITDILVFPNLTAVQITEVRTRLAAKRGITL